MSLLALDGSPVLRGSFKFATDGIVRDDIGVYDSRGDLIADAISTELLFPIKTSPRLLVQALDVISQLRSSGVQVGGCSGYNDAILGAVTEVSPPTDAEPI